MRAAPPAGIALLADVDRRPAAAAVFDAAGLAGRELLGHDDALIEVGADVAERLVHELRVDRPAQREHRRDCEHRERQPLRHDGQLEADEPEQADDDRRETGEHEIELRVDGQ